MAMSAAYCLHLFGQQGYEVHQMENNRGNKIDDKNEENLILPRFLQRVAERFSLSLVFSLPFTLQFIAAACLISLLLFRGGQVAVDSVLQDMRQEVMARVQEQLSRHIREPLRLNRLNVDAFKGELLNLSSPFSRERYFVNHIRAFPDVAMSFVGLADGTFYGARRKASGEIQVVRNNRDTGGDSWYYTISEQGDALERQEVFKRFDARTRPWYQVAQQLGKPVFTGVYRHFVFLEPTITAAHPIFDNEGRIIGVFGVDYLLPWLGNMLRGLTVGPSGQVFITDADGLLVASSKVVDVFEQKNGQMERLRALDCADRVVQLAVSSLPDAGYTNSYEFKLDNRSYFVDVQSFQESGIDWRIYVVLAGDDFLGGIKDAVRRTAFLMITIIILVFLLAIWTSRWVTRPILQMNAAARELAEGRLQQVPETKRRDELGQLSRSFNMMARQMTDLVTNLEARVGERTKDLAEKTWQEQNMREKLHAELAKAGFAQRSMLPANINDPQIRLEIIYEPSMLVSGDFCGYQWKDEGAVLFGYLIDVTGHGAATALQTAAINVMLQESAYLPLSLSKRLQQLNERIFGYFGDDVLVAAFCFELDFKRHKLCYVAAGITEFFVESTAMQGHIKTPGLFLGVSKTPDFDECSIAVQEGDRLCFYSDGIADHLTAKSGFPLGGDFTELVEYVRNITADGEKRDDVTAMCIEIGALHRPS